MTFAEQLKCRNACRDAAEWVGDRTIGHSEFYSNRVEKSAYYPDKVVVKFSAHCTEDVARAVLGKLAEIDEILKLANSAPPTA